MAITEFREQVIEKMMFTDENQEEDKTSIENNPPKKKKKTEHKLERKEGLAHKIRKYCVRCYKKKQDGEISKNNVRKVTTFCADCPILATIWGKTSSHRRIFE